MGGADPTSGTVSLLEVVRGFGALLRKGWKPLRTGDRSSGTQNKLSSDCSSQLSLRVGMLKR